jgi:hypothetical protein
LICNSRVQPIQCQTFTTTTTTTPEFWHSGVVVLPSVVVALMHIV